MSEDQAFSSEERVEHLRRKCANLRADNTRLQSLCDEQGKGIMDAGARLKVALEDNARLVGEVEEIKALLSLARTLENSHRSDLQRHKTELEKAKWLLDAVTEHAAFIADDASEEWNMQRSHWLNHINEVLGGEQTTKQP